MMKGHTIQDKQSVRRTDGYSNSIISKDPWTTIKQQQKGNIICGHNNNNSNINSNSNNNMKININIKNDRTEQKRTNTF